jgi:hypothetical protein
VTVTCLSGKCYTAERLPSRRSSPSKIPYIVLIILDLDFIHLHPQPYLQHVIVSHTLKKDRTYLTISIIVLIIILVAVVLIFAGMCQSCNTDQYLLDSSQGSREEEELRCNPFERATAHDSASRRSSHIPRDSSGRYRSSFPTRRNERRGIR